jgi:hypothetical protein
MKRRSTGAHVGRCWSARWRCAAKWRRSRGDSVNFRKNPVRGPYRLTFKPEGDKTLVTWSMAGKNNFIGRAVCLFMDMDKMVGGEFEKGLNQLKSIVEA